MSDTTILFGISLEDNIHGHLMTSGHFTCDVYWSDFVYVMETVPSIFFKNVKICLKSSFSL